MKERGRERGVENRNKWEEGGEGGRGGIGGGDATHCQCRVVTCPTSNQNESTTPSDHRNVLLQTSQHDWRDEQERQADRQEDK